jgi:hypothetical protein
VLKKKIWANFQRIIELFTQKIVTKLSKIWILDPGVKKAPDPGSATLVGDPDRMFSSIPDRDPLVRGTDPDPVPDRSLIR